MPIPETLSARRAELERLILRHEANAVGYDARAVENRESAMYERHEVAILRARIEEMDATVAVFDAAGLAEQSAPEKRERRDLRKLVLEYIGAGDAPVSRAEVQSQFQIGPYRARDILSALVAAGKITGDDNGWRLVRGEGEDIKMAAE